MLQFTPQQEELRQRVRAFAEQELAPIAQEIHDQDTCPVELFEKTGQLGFNGIFVPVQYGGAGMGHVEQAIILEEIGRYSAGFGAALVAHYMGVYAIMTWGTEEQKRKYLPRLCAGELAGFTLTEPGGGSDFTGMQATGRREGDFWLLNGRKCFITNSHCMGVNVINVNTGQDSKGRPEISVFIVEGDTPGHTPGRKEKKAGLRGSYMGDINLNNLRLPASNLLGQPGDGSKISLGTLGVMGRGGSAAVAVGILRACLEDAVKFAQERIIYGQPLSKLTNIQFIIAQNRTDYEAARLLTYNAMARKDAGLPNTAEISMAKFFAAEAAVNAAKRTMDLMGGYGLLTDYPVHRYLLDATGTISTCGTSHIMQLIIAGDTLKNSGAGKTAKAGGTKPSEPARKVRMLTGELEEIAEEIVAILRQAGFIDGTGTAKAQKPSDLPLEKAPLVVAGGWGVGEEAWPALTQLAQELGGAVGCTRPALDEGWAKDRQGLIGISGKTIKPRIYLGFGISGSPHHTAGMKNSEVVISINKDHAAPIFKVSDYGAVADARELLPLLLAKIKAVRV